MNKRVGVGIVAAAAGLIGAAVAIVPGIASGSGSSDLHASQVGVDPPLVAAMTGANEFPGPGSPTGKGAATVTIDGTTNTICWNIAFTGLTDHIADHIHEGAAGVAGPIRVNFNNTLNGCTVDTTYAPLILANPSGFYVNVHSTDYPNGAIRGQLAVSAVGPSGPAHFFPSPLRAYDSRTADGKLGAGQTRTISLAAGLDGAGAMQPALPPGATAAIVNLTVTDTEGAGFLTMYAAGSPLPATSSINWSESNQNIAVNAPVATNKAGEITVTGGVNPTNFVVDVIGYYTAPAA